jgi:transposase
MLERFNTFLTELTGKDLKFDTTLVFDKGNNSEENFALVDALQLHYVSSVKLDQVKDLAQVSNQSQRFSPCKSPALRRPLLSYRPVSG